MKKILRDFSEGDFHEVIDVNFENGAFSIRKISKAIRKRIKKIELTEKESLRLFMFLEQVFYEDYGN